MNSYLTVLTDPVPYGLYFPIEMTKRIVRRARNIIKPPLPFMRSSYRGHFAVTRSLVEGLRKINANANYNPNKLAEIGDTVIVLSGLPALRQAIQLKRRGRIKKLLAGPNILVFPSSHQGIISAPEVDLCITPCEYTNRMYTKDCPALSGRCVAWPAGVDTEYWKPDPGVKRDWILIFEKQHTGPIGSVKDYKRWLESQGYKVQIIQYGHFSHQQYLQALRQALLMVGFVRSESQGVAWAEAWSTDVPTLIWRNPEDYSYQGKTYASSTAPYLTSETGLFFDDLEHFKTVFSQWTAKQNSYQPRCWVMKNMSDEVCAQRLWEIAGLEPRRHT